MNEQNQILIVRIGNELFSLPLLAAASIQDKPKLSLIPKAPNYFLGVFNRQGRILPLADLAQYVKIKRDSSKDSKVVIVEQKGITIGFCVDEIFGNISLDKEDIEELKQSKNLPFVERVIRIKNNLINILDMEKIFEITEKLENL